MERAEAFQRAAGLVQLDVLADDVGDIEACLYFFDFTHAAGDLV